MSGAAWFEAVLSQAGTLAELAVQWLVQSTLVLGVGLVVAAVWGRRSPALRSAVYQTTLLVALACPLAAYLLAASGWTLVAIELPAARYEYFETVAVPVESVEEPAPVVEAAADAIAVDTTDFRKEESELLRTREVFAEPRGEFAMPAEAPIVPAPRAIEELAAAEELAEESPQAAEPVAPATEWQTRRVEGIRPLVAALLLAVPGVWLLVATVMLARLGLDHWRLARLRRSAVVANEAALRLCRKLSQRLNTRAPRLLRTPLVTSPCLAGVLRPAILLPEELEGESLSAVLVHELAHRRRNDCLWNLLRQLGTALLWPQPLMWRLSQRLEAAAEDVCDDYVVEYGESRAAYAAALVAIAERNLLPASGAAVPLVTLRSLLGRRVQRILDHSRRLTLSIGLAALALVAAGGISAGLLAGMLGPATSTQAAVAADDADRVARDVAEETADKESPQSTNDAATDETATDGTVAARGETLAVGDDDLVTVRGVVLDRQGKPVADAPVAAVRWYWHTPRPLVPLATTRTNAAGEFVIDYRKSQFASDFGRPEQWREAAIVATQPGYGPDWKYYSELEPGGRAVLRLVEDQPIRGRIVDLEGQPVAGASLQMESIYRNDKEDLTRWVDAMRAGVPYFGSQDYDQPNSSLPTASLSLGESVTTGDDGRFEITGVGRSRYAVFKLIGPGVAVTQLRVVTLPTETFVADFGQAHFKNPLAFHGAEFEYSAEPSQPLVGVVRDAETRQPLAGVRVIADKLAGGTLSGLYAAETVSDERGQYRLDGLPRGKGNGVLAVPGDDLPYFMRELGDVPTAPGFDPVTFDIELHRGISITGQLRETESGAPARARMFYLPWPDNPHIKGLPEFNSNHLHGSQSRYETDLEGRFRLVGLPGRGLVAAVAVGKPYPSGQGHGAIADLPTAEAFRKVVGVLAPTKLYPTAIHEIRPEADADEVEVDFRIDAGKSLPLRLVDGAGQPLGGVQVNGLWPKAMSYRAENVGPQVEVLALAADEKRLILVHDAQRKLGKATEVQLSDAGGSPLDVVLEPCARLKVRLVDADRKPLVGVLVRFRPVGESDFGRELPRASTDKDGNVDTPTLLPGCSYDLTAESPEIDLKNLIKGLEVAPGETIDLGEIDVTGDERPEPKRTPLAVAGTVRADESQAGDSQNGERLAVRGVVLDVDGKPAAGVRVRAFGVEPRRMSGADTTDIWQKLTADGLVSGADGRFEIDLRKTADELAAWPAAFPAALVVATAENRGPAWLLVTRAKLDEPLTLRLVQDQPLTVRLVDLEGQPVAGASVTVQSLETNVEEDQSAWLEALRGGTPYRAAQSLRGTVNPLGIVGRWGLEKMPFVEIAGTTDQQGLVRLAGVGSGRLARLFISGPGLVAMKAMAMALPMEAINVDMAGAGVPPRQNIFGAELTIALENSSPIEGVVRDAETGQPLAGVRVVSNRFAGTDLVGNHMLGTYSDAEGRYRLDGMPSGSGNELLAIPPRDQPYFLRNIEVPESRPLETVSLDLKLHRGVLIEGAVRDAETKEPILGALHYLPWPDHPQLEERPELTQGFEAGPQDHFHTDADGRFRIVGLPGRGLLLLRRTMNAASERSYPVHQGVDAIADLPGDDEFRRTSHLFTPRSAFTTAVKEVNAAEQGITTADIELREGNRVALKLVDPDGKPVTGARVRGLAPPGQFYSYDNLGPDVEVAGLAPDERRRVVIEQPERRLGISLEVSVASQGRGPVEVRLEPCATIVGRVLDDGEPVAGAMIFFQYRAAPNFVERLSTTTQRDGSFTFDALPPGVELQVRCERNSPRFTSKTLIDKLTAAGGERIDLGTIDITSDERPEPKRTLAKADAAASREATPPNESQNGLSDSNNPLIIRGVVLDADGRPQAGALVKAYRDSSANKWAKDAPAMETTSGADGRFAIDVPQVLSEGYRSGKPWPLFGVVAKAEGVADTHLRLNDEQAAANATIRMTPFSPLEGRIVNLEGQPVQGVTVQLRQVNVTDVGELGPYLEALRAGKSRDEIDDAIKPRMSFGHDDLRKANIAVTDADGRFRLERIGRHHVALLRVSGGGVVAREIAVANAQAESAPYGDNPRNGDSDRLYALPFQYAVEPAPPIVGVVRDADTRQPIAGVKIVSTRYEEINKYGFPILEAVTDDEGRYRLEGVRPKPNRGELQRFVVRSTGEVPYLPREFDAPEAGKDLGPVTHDIELHRGVWIEGRVTDAVTGEPVAAKVEYLPWYDNPRVDHLPEYQGNGTLRLDGSTAPNTDEQGRYRLIGIPGRGLVQISYLAVNRYPIGQGFDAIPDLAGAAEKFERLGNANTPRPEYNIAIREFIADEDAQRVEVNLSLQPGKTVTISVVEASGQAVEVSHAYGLDPHHVLRTYTDLGDKVEVIGLSVDVPRTVVMMNVERRLGAVIEISLAADSAPERTVTFQPLATIIGRLVDAAGEPLPPDERNRESVRLFANPHGRSLVVHQTAADADGHFKLLAAPGPLDYGIFATNVRGSLIENLRVEPGERIDLGTIDITSDERPEPKRTLAKANAEQITIPVAWMEEPRGAGGDAAKVAAPDADEVFEFAGSVVDAAGRPAAGAEVFVSYYTLASPNQIPQGVTRSRGVADAEGKFAFAMKASEFVAAESLTPWDSARLVAKLPGQGLGWLRAAACERSGRLRQVVLDKTVRDQEGIAQSLESSVIKLVADDVPLRGRIVNLEGEPVAGARVRVIQLLGNRQESLDAWLAVAESDSGDFYSTLQTVSEGFHGYYLQAQLEWLIPAVTTDADGRFEIAGLGRERIAQLQIEPPGYETRQIYVRTRAGRTIELPMQRGQNARPPVIYHGAEFAHVAAPSPPVEGVVRDWDTGEPLPGVTICSYQLAGDRLVGWSQGYIRTTSDAEGRYRLAGLPIGENRIAAHPAADQPYLSVTRAVRLEPGKMVSADVKLKRGVWIEGRAIDAASGKPLQGRVEYFVFNDNPQLRPNGERLRITDPLTRTDAEGRYRIVGLPGRGLVTLLVHGGEMYPRGAGADEIEGGRVDGQDLLFNTSPHYAVRTNAHLFREINPAADAERIECDLVLDSGPAIVGTVVDEQGQPLRGCEVAGQIAMAFLQPIRETEFVVRHLQPGQKRWVLAHHAGRNLAGSLIVRAEDAGPLRVTLVPAGAITGRLVDEDGAAIDEAWLYAGSGQDEDPQLRLAMFPKSQQIFTDADGRFTITGLAPGVKYTAVAGREGRQELRFLGTVFEDVTIASGETKDLGDLVPREKSMAITGTFVPNPQPPMREAKAERDSLTFAGQVVDADGKPFAGAKLHVLYYTPKYVETKPRATSDADGKFRFSMNKSDFEASESGLPWEGGAIVAVAEGYGPAWVTLAGAEVTGEIRRNLEAKPNFDPTLAELDATIRLVADDVPIEGRLIDLEGQPVAGARVQVIEVHASRQNSLDAWIDAVENKQADYYQAREHAQHGFGGLHLRQQVAQLFPEVKTDGEGRFRLSGIGRERIVLLEIKGRGVETRQVHVRTRPGKTYELLQSPRDPQLGTVAYHGSKCELAIGPSRDVVGTVRDEQTGAALAGVTVASDKLAGQAISGAFHRYVNTTTDAEGRYRLSGLPVGQNRIVALAKDGEPHLDSSRTVEVKLDAEASVDFELSPGIWIRGRVTDAKSGDPLRAWVEHFAFRDNPAGRKLDSRQETRVTTDPDGRFAVRGVPGAGIVGVTAINSERYPRGAGAEQITHGRENDGGINFRDDQTVAFRTVPSLCVSTTFHLLKEIDPEGDEPFEIDFALEAGPSLQGKLLDPDGQPLAGAMFADGGAFGTFRPPVLKTHEFTVQNFVAGKPRRISFYHAERKLAGSRVLSGDEQSPIEVQLAPWGTVTGRVLMKSGEPADNVLLYGTDFGRPRSDASLGIVPDRPPLRTDGEGRFRIEMLAADTPYALSAVQGRMTLGTVIDEFKVAAGETKDLGDLTIEPPKPAVAEKPRAKEPPPKAAGEAKAERDVVSVMPDVYVFAGVVLDPDGKPAERVDVALLYYDGTRSVLSPAVATGRDGRFLLKIPAEKVALRDAGSASVVAVSAGRVGAWDAAAPFELTGAWMKTLAWRSDYGRFEESRQAGTLRLAADDVPISARLVDLEGQPVAGARVQVRSLHTHPAAGLTAWLAAAEHGGIEMNELWQHVPVDLSAYTSGEAIGHLLPHTTSDDAGRFELNGIGRDRLVELVVSADGMETRSLYVRTRPGAEMQIPWEVTDPAAGGDTIYGPRFEYVLAPSRAVEGVVRDVDSGEPLAGIQVVPENLAGSRLHSTVAHDALKTITDAEGRYRLTGLPIGENRVAVLPPRDMPYVAAALEVDTSGQVGPAPLDFRLKRGVWVRGRVTDAATGQPLRGRAEYYALNTNPLLRSAPGSVQVAPHHGWTDPDGRYQVIALPGAGILSIYVSGESDVEPYPRGAGSKQIEGEREGLSKIFRTSPHNLMAADGHYFARLDIDAGAEAVVHDVRLDAGKAIAAMVLDPDGRPLVGAQAAGISSFGTWHELKSAEFEVLHVMPGQTRRVQFYHAGRNLAGSFEVRHDMEGVQTWRLQPAGTLVGRLLDEYGEPAARVNLWAGNYLYLQAERGIHPGGQYATTDSEGRFRISGLVPHERYTFDAIRAGVGLGVAAKDVATTAGETKDLGDLMISDPRN